MGAPHWGGYSCSLPFLSMFEYEYVCSPAPLAVGHAIRES
jgi:hypothetical protein